MTTDEKRWKRLDDLLAQALQQPADQREAWVAGACGGDPELEADLLELLRYDAEATGGLASSIATASARVSKSLIGTSVGSYRITDRIAEGGMGVVYVGQREGADFDQRVAIKIMHSHKFNEVADARFVAERRILASLNHPNLARLIDGGMTTDGLPYIVMEYIDGENIAGYCARHNLDNERIIRLVIDVCGALQYAHNQLVIHRDIKPSNILVDASGAPRLLDFGIAKLLEQDGSDGELTRPEWRAITPLYASPEQLGNQPVSTAADVYGVGLLLYRLLTGRLPYIPTSDHPHDVENAILSMPAETPSSAVTNADGTATAQWIQRQKKALRGDLDTILLTALRKEPERRYATVDALAEDLDRYLKHLPIRARRDTLGYRVNKFVARHRLPVALTALLVGLAIGLTTFYTARLNTEREVAQQTAGFLAGLFEDSNPYHRSREGLTVSALVATGADKVQSDDTLAPLVRGRLLRTIAVVYNNLGDTDRAEPLIQEALALFQGEAAHADQFDALITLSEMRLNQGRYEDGLVANADARRLAEEEFGERSLQVASAANQAAYLHYRLGNYDALYEEVALSLDIRESLLPDNAYAIARSHHTLSTYYQVTGDPAKAVEHLEISLQIKAEYDSEELGRAVSLQNLGILKTDLGNFSAAVEHYREAIDIRRRASGAADPYLPHVLYALAHTTGKLGHFGEAHRLFTEQLALQISLTSETHDTVAYALNGHGDLLANMGATTLADKAFTRALEIYTLNEKPAGHFDRSVTLAGFGKVARDRGELDKAEDLLRQALDIRSDRIGEEHTFTQLARIDLADVILRQGRLADARTAFERALEILRANGAAEHPTAAQALTGLAQGALQEGQPADAIQKLEQAINMTKASIGRDHLDNVNRRLLLADALDLAGDPEQAAALRAPANATRERIMAEWSAALEAPGADQ